MLIIFTSKVHPDVVMFGDIATRFLHAMGESGQPPGILRGENIRPAAERLRCWLNELPGDDAARKEEAGDEQAGNGARESKTRVSLKQRALPLLELMDASYHKDSDVIWR